MFNMSGSEIIFILLLALVVLGPEKLPEAMRRVGRTYGELKRMSSSFQEEFRSQIDEPMREMRNTADLIRRNVDIGAVQAEKPKSEAAMSVDMEPDPPPGEPEGVAPLDPQGDLEPQDGLEPDDEGARLDGEQQSADDRPAPAAADGFGAVPSYADRGGESWPDEQADPEPTP